MREIPISKFRAQCGLFLDQVNKTGRPIRITRRRKPMVEIIPLASTARKRKLGDMIGKIEIVGDIISPVLDVKDFEGYRD